MEITNVEYFVLESAVGTVSIPGGMSDFHAGVSPVLVKVHTDEGITGIGETYIDDPTGDKVQFVGKGVQALANEIVGKNPLNVKKRWYDMYIHVKRMGGFRPMSAIDEALWDIKGKHAGQPVYELLGGSVTEVKAYATYPYFKPTDEVIEDAVRLHEKGFEAMKIIIAHGVDEDRERIRKVAENIPDDFGLAIDANTTYDFADALPVAETASEHELEWFEEPIPHTNIEGQAELNRRTSVPISGYQTHSPHYPAVDHLDANALEIYQPAVDMVGGITAADRVATLVEAHNKRLVPHAFGPVVNYSASLHVTEASPACSLIEFAIFDEDIDDLGEFVASPYIANQDDVYVQDGGTVKPPEAPGLGLEVDEEKLEEYRVN